MTAELAAYTHQLDWVLEQHLVCVDGLTADELVWRPPIAGANHVSAIVAHSVAVTRAFVLGVVGGQPLKRNRPAEFETLFESIDELAAAVEGLRAELRAIDPGGFDLGASVTPGADTWGSEPDGPMQKREVMAEALRHASIHLGELRFTRGLIDAQRAARP